jgi:hypothetical protein
VIQVLLEHTTIKITTRYAVVSTELIAKTPSLPRAAKNELIAADDLPGTCRRPRFGIADIVRQHRAALEAGPLDILRLLIRGILVDLLHEGGAPDEHRVGQRLHGYGGTRLRR